MTTKITNYKCSEEVRETLMNCMKALLEECQINNIPMFVTCAMENDENGTVYERMVYGAKSHMVRLTEDQIEKHILVANHFGVVPPRSVMTLDVPSVSAKEIIEREG